MARKKPYDPPRREYPFVAIVGDYNYEGRMELEKIALLGGQWNAAGKVVDVVRRQRTTAAEVTFSNAIVGEVYGETMDDCYENTLSMANEWCQQDAAKLATK